MRAVMGMVDGQPRVLGGLSTGEGLIAAVRDGNPEDDEDVSVSDKRLMVIEPELGRVLRAASRHGSTMSAVMRCAWDGVPLGIVTKSEPMVATDPHIAVLGHVTRTELSELLESTDIWNGFTNRFLWVCVRRRDTIPFPKGISDMDRDRIAAAIAKAAGHADEVEAKGGLTFTKEARRLWRARYDDVTAEQLGVLGVVTARAEAQILRLALTYALLDQADAIWVEHLEAALAFHQYAVDSARFIFSVLGEMPRDPVADQIITALKGGPKTQTQIRDHFSRHDSGKVAAALQGLQERGQVTCRTEATGGRPRQVWTRSDLATKATKAGNGMN